MSRAGEPSEDSPGLEIGRVSKAHGITGELRIVPHWESSDALEQVSEIWLTLQGQRTAYAVERARAVPRAYLVKLRGVDDRNAAEALHGATVSVPRSVLPPLEPGEYYLIDLIGAKVIGPEGEAHAWRIGPHPAGHQGHPPPPQALTRPPPRPEHSRECARNTSSAP